MKNNKSVLKIVAIVVLVIVLLAAAVISIFNGVVEIIEEVLGNIMGFLTDPLDFINQAIQDASNTLTTLNPFDTGRRLQI